MTSVKNTMFYFLNIDLGEKRTGIESSALLRARIFERYLNIIPIITTTKYNPRLSEQRLKLVKKGLISERIEILNIYEHYQETNIKYIEQRCNDQFSCLNNNWTYKTVDNTNDIRIYDQNKVLIAYCRCDNRGIPIYINIFINGKMSRRHYYDHNGKLSKIQYLDIKTRLVLFEIYFNIHGKPCIYKHFEINSNDNKKTNLLCIQLVGDNGNILETFSNEHEFIKYWLEEILKDEDHNFMIIDKERVYYPALKNINRDNISILCMVHSSHLKDNQPLLTGKLNKNYESIFKDTTIPDAIIVLTEKQKEHIELRFGQLENLIVIPHSIDGNIEQVKYEERHPLSAVYLARYSDEKQHKSLIRIFSKVVKKHPEALLYLYGFGKLKGEIVNLIKMHGLQSNILVNDFVENPEVIYNKASLAVSTSRVEGFSLFILESLAHGLPVVSYDINYGPRDMIRQGVNGYLVELDDEDVMAEKIIDLFNNPKKLSEMSKEAYKTAQQFDYENIANKWASLFEKLYPTFNSKDNKGWISTFYKLFK